MRRLCVLVPFLLVLLAVSKARADVSPGPGFPPPQRPRPQPAIPPVPRPKAPRIDKMPLVIEIDNRVRIPRLQIPKKLLPGAGAAGAAPGVRGAEAPAEEPRQHADAGPRRLPTLVAGVALSLGFVSAGLWLVRRRGGRRAVTLSVVVGLLILGGAALWADVPVGPLPRPQPPRPPQPAPAPKLPQLLPPTGVVLPANIEVEVVEKGQALKLILNKNMVLPAARVRPRGVPDHTAPSDEE